MRHNLLSNLRAQLKQAFNRFTNLRGVVHIGPAQPSRSFEKVYHQLADLYVGTSHAIFLGHK